MTPRELITDYLAAARRGDWDAAFAYFAPDIVMRVPGRSAFAGEHRGRDAAIGYIDAVRKHFRRGTIELELIDMLVSDERVALLLRERFRADGPPVEIRRANVYRVDGNQIVEITIFEADPHAVEALMADIASAEPA